MNDNQQNENSRDDLTPEIDDIDVTASEDDEILNESSDVSEDDPDLSPNRTAAASGAGRRLNDRALYIVFALGAVFIFFVFWVMYDKSQTPEMFSAAEQKQNDSAGRLADQITANAPEGFVAPAVQDEPPPPKEEEATAELSPTAQNAESPPPVGQTLDLSVASDVDHSRPPVPPRTDEEIRVRQLKIQMFEQALYGKTGVPIDGYADQVQGQQNRTSTAANDDVKSRLAESRARLARLQSSGGSQDANQVYMEKLAAIKGGGGQDSESGTVGASSQGYFEQSSNGDRWALQNNKGQGEPLLDKPRTSYELRAGGVIPATMISGINSDLPGQIIGQTTQDVYDTATGKFLVIPQGTRLIGMYDAQTKFGQERVLIVWQRLIFPDGKALDLGSMPGADGAGYSGFRDKVETHFWRSVGSAFLMSGVIAGVNLSQNSNDNGGNSQRAGDAMSEALGQTLGQTLAQMIQKNLNVAPTIEIRPGYRFNVIITKDIPFQRPYKSFDY